MSGTHLLDGLNERQRQAVTATGGPLVVLAGAGSGKTRVLTRRIAYRVLEGDTDPRRVLALTFTRKAAGEMRTRLRQLGLRDDVVAGTFHGIALTQLRERWTEKGITPPTLLDRKYRMVSQLLGRRSGIEPMDVVSEIEWARARMIEPADYETAAQLAGRTPPIPSADMAEILHRFAQEKRQRRVVDFDDLLALALRDILTDPDYAAAVRWRHRHLYVDEFQDVNPLQFELLKAWRGRTNDLFVVGDPNQAIYGWNGADPDLLVRFAKRERTAIVIPLADNYRSTPQILNAASAALAGKAGQLIPHRHDGAVPTITAYPSEEAEAAGIADALRAARSVGEPWAHQAVLVRTNAQLVPIEQALVASRIPVRVRGGGGPLASPEVKSKLRELSRPGVDLQRAVADLVRSGTVPDDTDGPISSDLDADESADRPAGPAPSLTPAEIDRRQNLGALANLLRDYLAVDPMPNGPGLAAWIATIQAGEVATNVDAVELATFHSAKGLEWPVVHLAGIEAGFVPISYAKTGGQLAEEQRLLYVAVTRAERELHLTWAASRTFGTRARKRTVSPYLSQIEDAIDHMARGQRPLDWRAKVEDSRVAIASSDIASPAPASAPPAAIDLRVKRPRVDETISQDHALEAALLEVLQSWRRDRARAADVPAHVVFNDQTLRAIALSHPTSRAGLASINGVSAAKLERYGDEMISLIRSVTSVA